MIFQLLKIIKQHVLICSIYLKALHGTFTASLLIQELFKNIYLNWIDRFSLFTLKTFFNLVIIYLLSGLTIYWHFINPEFSLMHFQHDFMHMQNEIQVFLGYPSAFGDGMNGYRFLLDYMPDLIKFIKKLSCNGVEIEHFRILDQIKVVGVDSLTNNEKQFILKNLRSQYVYHLILYLSGDSPTYKCAIFLNEIANNLLLLGDNQWLQATNSLDFEPKDLNNYFK